MSNYNAQELEDYGVEILDTMRRQAKAATAGEIANLQQGMAEVQRQLRGEKHRYMKAQLDKNLSDWRSQNHDEKFLAWLGERDAMNGRSRQSLLNDAWVRGDADAVEAIFRAGREAGRSQGNVGSGPGTAWGGSNRLLASVETGRRMARR